MASAVEWRACDPEDVVAQEAVRAYYAELDRRFPTGFVPDEDDGTAFRTPNGAFLVAVCEDLPVACGGFRSLDGDIAEIKRMWVRADRRGEGLGRGMLERLESLARERGARSVRLDTNAVLHSAIALYRNAGYREIARYNDNPYAAHWFEKAIHIPTTDAVDRKDQLPGP